MKYNSKLTNEIQWIHVKAHKILRISFYKAFNTHYYPANLIQLTFINSDININMKHSCHER